MTLALIGLAVILLAVLLAGITALGGTPKLAKARAREDAEYALRESAWAWHRERVLAGRPCPPSCPFHDDEA